MIFGIKRKIDNFDRYNVFLSIAINKPQRLKTGFVLLGHIWSLNKKLWIAILKTKNEWSEHPV